MKRAFLIFSLFLFVSNLQSQDTSKNNPPTSREVDFITYPVLWHQTSAEYRALCYQAFNVARTYLETIIPARLSNEQYAIITDLDETIIDNSFLEAKNIKEGKVYDAEGWKKWVNSATATGIPGAVDFLRWAAVQNITIFYISNRTVSDVNATIENLKKLQLPYADREHMLFLADGATKEPRRKKVAENHKIVMLLGDNLNDFSNVFERRSIQDRKAETDKLHDEWGKRFIVLPNAIYGEWESAIYDYNRKLTPQQKEEKRKENLTGY
ncbi:MAG: 5'-nucleotidase, lipoprotein e(P4) family [Bacteroidetes bacterium GWF2_40_14]|nr:MAG: 5'-nucleotidase, lipoprotein e(P4) family [Bacteroidetes bacterium GWF2_40_14]